MGKLSGLVTDNNGQTQMRPHVVRAPALLRVTMQIPKLLSALSN